MKRGFQCILLALLVAALSTMTGCWNYQELENRYVVSGIAFDKGKQGHRYRLSFEVLDLTGGNTQSAEIKTKLFESEGDTVADAVNRASKTSDKSLYFSDCKVLIFSKDIAKEGLTPALDWLNRDPRPRFTVQVFVSQENTAGELFQTESKSGGIISFQIANSMESFATGGKSLQMHLYDVDNILLGEGKDLVLPCLQKSRQGKNPPVEVYGTAVFRGDKYAGALDDRQTGAYLFLMDTVQSGMLLVGENPEDREIALRIRKSSLETKPEISGEKISMKIGVKLVCSFEEENSYRQYLSDVGIKRVQNFAVSAIRKRIPDSIRQVQTDFDCDIYGFGRKIYQENPQEWKKLKPVWRERFRTLTVEISPDVSISDTEFTYPKGQT
jgi:spore germination protein KC